ncbi:hypothetical protein QAD02_009949, partial [Eretmocerus hayati]
ILSVLVINGNDGSRYPRLTTRDRADHGEFPHMVSIQYRGDHRCGGALISYRHVLTAAHCVHNETEKDFWPHEFVVIVGSTNLANPDIGSLIEVERIGYHPGFTAKPVYPQIPLNDIAVLRLAESIPKHKNIEPVKLPTTLYQEYDGGMQLFVTGFGAAFAEGAPSPYLRKMIVLQVHPQSCQRVYRRPLDVSDMCAISVENFDACPGDSGSPLILRRERLIVGVLSEAPPDGCGSGKPTVYTKVSHHLNFIKSEMQDSSRDVL